MPPPLPEARWALTPPFRPGRTEARWIAFCGTFPGVAPAGHYPAPSFRGARTFLAPACAGPRPPGLLAGAHIAKVECGCKPEGVSPLWVGSGRNQRLESGKPIDGSTGIGFRGLRACVIA